MLKTANLLVIKITPALNLGIKDQTDHIHLRHLQSVLIQSPSLNTQLHFYYCLLSST